MFLEAIVALVIMGSAVNKILFLAAKDPSKIGHGLLGITIYLNVIFFLFIAAILTYLLKSFGRIMNIVVLLIVLIGLSILIPLLISNTRNLQEIITILLLGILWLASFFSIYFLGRTKTKEIFLSAKKKPILQGLFCFLLIILSFPITQVLVGFVYNLFR